MSKTKIKTRIKTPNRICIGDPYYLDEPIANRNSLIFKKTFPKNFLSSLSVTHNEDEGFVEILICFAPDEKHLKAYEEESYFSACNMKKIDLGCDTACFRIEVDDREDVIHTMADGYYGYAASFTYNRKSRGSFVSLVIDEDIYDERIESSIKYLFIEGENNNEN